MNFDFESNDDFIYDSDIEPDDEIVPTDELESPEHGEAFEFVDISSTSIEDFAAEPDPRYQKKPRNKKRITVNVILSVVMSLCLVLLSGAGAYVHFFADKTVKPNKMSGAEEVTEEQDEELYGGMHTSDSADVTYFLVLGCDWTSSKQTDVMVVVCMDHKSGEVSMLQIPRDTFVNSHMGGTKINAIFNNPREGRNRINDLRRNLSNQLGIPIDHYVLFSIEGAVKVVDAVGGVEMKVKYPVRIEDPTNFGQYYTIGPGEIHLSGKDAIGFMRTRRADASEDPTYDGSDIGRIKQQRKFYKALFKRLINMDIKQIWDVAKNCMDDIMTDMTINEIVGYADAVKKLDMKDIHIFGLPGQACNYNGVSYYSVHKDEYVEVFNEYFNPYGEEISEEDIHIPEIYKMAGHDKNNYWMTTDDTKLEDIE